MDIPVKTIYPVRIMQTDFSEHFPPTVYGMECAVLQWEPIYQANANGRRAFPIVHDVQVEEAMEKFTVHITALVDPEMARRLEEAEINWTVDVIRERLEEYLDHYRPLGIVFDVRVLVQAPHQEGPYR